MKTATEMIKLFRKIRFDLMKQNKMSKYFKYAIGEIILVVVGILIALQINEWNQAKKDRKLEKQYYCRLLEDVKQDYSNYEYSLELLNERIDANNIMIKRLLDETLPLDSMTPNLLRSVKFSNRNYRATTDALEAIKTELEQ